MVSDINVQVTVNLKEEFEKFTQLVDEITELRDLIPDHNTIEADKHYEKAIDLARDIVIIES